MLVAGRQRQVLDVDPECLADPDPGVLEELEQQPVAQVGFRDGADDAVDPCRVDRPRCAFGDVDPVEQVERVRGDQAVPDRPPQERRIAGLLPGPGRRREIRDRR
ncbi:hypothetical protein [Kribbella sancticallisti]|uniref:hypothetical protein n=1 Tax=Kribbella sancticallisti TaxID=460087 RepID=UPI0031DD1D66